MDAVRDRALTERQEQQAERSASINLGKIRVDRLLIDAHACALPNAGGDQIDIERERSAENIMQQRRTGRGHKAERAVELLLRIVAPDEIDRTPLVVEVALKSADYRHIPTELIGKTPSCAAGTSGPAGVHASRIHGLRL